MFLKPKVYFELEFFESRVCTYRYGLLNSPFQVVSSLPTLKSISDGWLVHGNVHSIKLVLVYTDFGTNWNKFVINSPVFISVDCNKNYGFHKFKSKLV